MTRILSIQCPTAAVCRFPRSNAVAESPPLLEQPRPRCRSGSAAAEYPIRRHAGGLHVEVQKVDTLARDLESTDDIQAESRWKHSARRIAFVRDRWCDAAPTERFCAVSFARQPARTAHCLTELSPRRRTSSPDDIANHHARNTLNPRSRGRGHSPCAVASMRPMQAGEKGANAITSGQSTPPRGACCANSQYRTLRSDPRREQYRRVGKCGRSPFRPPPRPAPPPPADRIHASPSTTAPRTGNVLA